MKKELLIKSFAVLALTFIFCTSSIAQGGWEEVHDIDGAFMRDICFVPGTDESWNTGWAIAYGGDIVKTTDGGDTWTAITQTLSYELAGISFADENTGFICTLDNKILKSVDGGDTWTTVYNGSVNFDKIAFKDDLNGVASGTEKLYTNDGGATWMTGTGGSSYWDVDYAGGSFYYGVNLIGGSLGKTNDDGATWSDIESLGQMAFWTDFMDENSGMFGGDLSKIMVTQDGGSTWSTNTLGSGQDAINCGGFFDADTIYACGSSGDVFKSTDGGDNWDTDTSFSSGVFQPRGFVVTGMNVLFAAANTSDNDGKVWRKIGAIPIDADFEADQTVVCVGSSVDFTDLSYGNITSWSWEFEGGSPATSTDQNPTVQYNSTGTFDVKLVVTVGAFADSLTRYDYIDVVALPGQADIPEGDDEVCTGLVSEYTTGSVEFAYDYEWELDPTNVGVLEVDDTTAILTVDDDWTGDFTLRVRASNVCGVGGWSGYLNGTAYQSPDVFTVEGDGGYCLDGEGAEITLSGSETGVDYELYLNDTPTGNVVAGTGSELSFGFITEEGFYTAYAENANCLLIMTNQVEVFILYPPSEPGTPNGPESICLEETSDYTSTGTDDADSYVWEISPEEAGVITSDGLDATVDWNADFSGIAMISLYGINECGGGGSSEVLEVSIGEPNPQITGESLVCDWSDEYYEVADNEGSTYTWEVTGGTITEGQGTYMVMVSWEGEGNGTLLVTEETVDGCEGSSELFEIVIDDCTGIPESKSSEINIYPNPATDYVKIESKEKINLIKMYNGIGNLIFTEKPGSSTVKANVSRFSKGLYILIIETDKGVVLKRVLVK